jgi:hypothetical protein
MGLVYCKKKSLILEFKKCLSLQGVKKWMEYPKGWLN